MLGRNVTGFVLLPDAETSRVAAERLSSWGNIEHSYPSGRPMLIRNQRSHRLSVAGLKDRRAAIVGEHSVSPEKLRCALSAIATNEGWDSFVSTTSGSFHLLVSSSGHLRAYGSAYGTCRLYYARYFGSILVSDRSFLLAVATQATVNPSVLSTYLIESPPFRLAEQPLWNGVMPVPPGHAIVLRHSATAPTIRRWREYGVGGHLDTPGAADAVRKALTSAVETRLAACSPVSSELSGGYDSTSVTAIASRCTEHLIGHTTAGRDPLNEDMHWASLAVQELSGIEHDVMAPHDHALFFDRILEEAVPLDEPSIATAGAARVMGVYRRLRDRGSSLHLTGHGGDQLFTHLAVTLQDCFRRKPLLGSRRALQAASYGNWPLRDLAQVFIDQRSFRSWWAAESQKLNVDDNQPRPLLGWGVRPRVAPWVTRSVVGQLRNKIATDLAAQGPLAPTRAENLRLEFIFNGARLGRALSQMATSIDLTLSTPFYDDEVVDSALSVDQVSTYSATEYKPLLAAAMAGITPDRILARKTKDDGSIDLVQGLANNAQDISSLFADSHLERMGLIDAEALRRTLKNAAHPSLDDGAIFATLACEMWVRTYATYSQQ